MDLAERKSQLFFVEGNLKESGAGYQKLIADRKEAMDAYYVGIAHVGLARVQILENQLSDAQVNLMVGLDILQKTSPENDVHRAYFVLGELVRLENNYPEAIKNYRASLQTTNDFLNYISFPAILDGIAKAECLQRNFESSTSVVHQSSSEKNGRRNSSC
jgi:tetratricopeptide (TPR) repeat protein